jgi:ABC-type phosphate/phosphonate transport system substrate-binding protein
MNKVRDFLKGKKTYIMAGIGLATALVAWADGQIDVTALACAIWAAVQTCFIRAGIDTAVQKGQQ